MTETEEPGQPDKTVKVSALIVSHNRAPLLQRCLESLENSEARDIMEILVVDNGSTDGSAELEPQHPSVRFIRLPRNFGLTKALNIGLRASAAGLLLLLHHDTELFPDTVSRLVSALESDPDVWAVCPLLVTAEGSPAPQVRDLPRPGRAGSVWREPSLQTEGRFTAEYARGAAMLVRGYIFQAMRQIDERYGVFGSDAEICFQIRRAGKKVVIVPEAKAVHHGSMETSTAIRALRSADQDLGIASYLSKHFGFISGLKSRIGATFRALAGLLRMRDLLFHLARLRYLIQGKRINGL